MVHELSSLRQHLEHIVWLREQLSAYFSQSVPAQPKLFDLRAPVIGDSDNNPQPAATQPC